jgi:hypothetical protein
MGCGKRERGRMPLSNSSVASLDLDDFDLGEIKGTGRRFQLEVGSAIGVVVLIIMAGSFESLRSTAYINITGRNISDKASPCWSNFGSYSAEVIDKSSV